MSGAPAPRAAVPTRRWAGLRIAACRDEAEAELLRRACADRFAIAGLDAGASRAERTAHCAGSDVVAVAGASERWLLREAMTTGCFPVAVESARTRAVIRSGVNGLLVAPDPAALRRALQWCATHLGDVRRAGRLNARLVAGESAAHAAVARGVVPARFALLAPEYGDGEGGEVERYTRNLARALVAEGHEVEVFTTGRVALENGAEHGVVVHRVAEAISRPWVRAALRALRAFGARRAAPLLLAAVDARRLSRALAEREGCEAFDAVHSSDHRVPGLFVTGRARAGRPHLVRASGADARLAARDARSGRWLHALQRRQLRGADVAYAPSRYLARHFAAQHGIALRVARPPTATVRELTPSDASDAALPAVACEDELPKRYFVHTGPLGTAADPPELVAALPRVWERAPDFEMVWIGDDRSAALPAWRARWGSRRRQMHWLGTAPEPLRHAVVSGAAAAVLPTALPAGLDDLDTAALDCLARGVPLIGTAGAGLAELGLRPCQASFVPAADPEALADAIAQRWLEGAPREGRDAPPLPPSLSPRAAVDALLALAGLRDGPVERPAPAAERSAPGEES